MCLFVALLLPDCCVFVGVQTISSDMEPPVTPTSPKPFREQWWHWKPTSRAQTEAIEGVLLSALDIPYTMTMVELQSTKINTLCAGSGPPLVMWHGMAAGLGLWVRNIPAFAEHYTVYAVDLPGFGLSGRPDFKGSDAADGEAYFVNVMEEWRQKMGIEQMVLIGHSMGGYLSGVYALNYPNRVRHLVLADPWGVAVRSEETKGRKIPWYWKMAAAVVTKFNPLAALRVVGPWGPDVITKVRGDIASKFEGIYEDPTVVLDYIYHINAEDPEGESAFMAMSSGLAWAKNPLIDRLPKLSPEVFRAITMSYDGKTNAN